MLAKELDILAGHGTLSQNRSPEPYRQAPDAGRPA
jgi:hypothetical protein